MSLASLIAEAEADVAKANPVAIMKAALADIEALKADGAALKADLEKVQAVVAAAQAVLTAILNVVYPGGAGIPAEISGLLAMFANPQPRPSSSDAK